MDPEFDRLQQALAYRIALERRLGSGGMYYIREGDEHAAWRAFEQQARVTPEPSSEDLNTRRFLRLGIHERFDPLRAGAANTCLAGWRVGNRCGSRVEHARIRPPAYLV